MCTEIIRKERMAVISFSPIKIIEAQLIVRQNGAIEDLGRRPRNSNSAT
jgi:hypothetical protein